MAGLPRTIPELVKKAIAGAMQDVHVALPGKVVRWDATLNLADVQVMVQHAVFDEDNDRTYEDLGNLLGVPVMWPRAGGMVITLPLTAGDSGLLVFCSSAIGEWRSTGQSSQPDDASRHSIGWPVFVPGLFPDSSPLSPTDVSARGSAMIVGPDGGATQIRVSNSDIKLGVPAVSPVSLSVPTDANFAALTAAISGLITSVGQLVSHTHPVTTAPGTTGAPSSAITAPPSAPTPGTTAATLVKAL